MTHYDIAKLAFNSVKYRLSGLSWHDVEDCLAETVTKLALLEKTGQIDHNQNVNGYLYIVARNTILKVARRKILRYKQSHRSLEKSLANSLSTQTEMAYEIRDAIKSLPNKRWQAICYLLYQGHTPSEIAKHFNVTRQAIMATIKKIRPHLHRAIHGD